MEASGYKVGISRIILQNDGKKVKIEAVNGKSTEWPPVVF
jgi:hypothetical protein